MVRAVSGGDGMQAGFRIKVQVLKGIVDVKGPHPQGHGKEQQNGRKAQILGGDAEPAGQRRKPQGGAQPVVAQGREALEQAVGAGKEQGRHGQPQADAVDAGAGRHENQGRNAAQQPCPAQGDFSSHQGAAAGARIGAVKGQVRNAVEAHGKGADAHHGNGQEEHGQHGRHAAGGKHGTGPGPGQGKDGMLDFDHAAEKRCRMQTG